MSHGYIFILYIIFFKKESLNVAKQHLSTGTLESEDTRLQIVFL